jgi:hypothetical protein
MTDDAGQYTQSITAIRKRFLVLLVLAGSNFVAFVVAATILHPAFVTLALALPMVCGLLMLALRCPRCSTPVFRRVVRIGGVPWTVWGWFWFPRECSQCGLPLGSRNPQI